MGKNIRLINADDLPVRTEDVTVPMPNAPGFQLRVEKPCVLAEDIENAPVIEAIPYWWIKQWNETKNSAFKASFAGLENGCKAIQYQNHPKYYTVEQLLEDWDNEQDNGWN